jgi:hypothetical protein|tara:strand:- start:48 stop:263 length:216 start_codon:yes stop_codon:yes gene_type:complete
MNEKRIERVAKAIAETQQFAWGLTWDKALKEDREHCREIARAAIKAMKPPSHKRALTAQEVDANGWNIVGS